MGVPKYDQKIMKSEIGEQLYAKWGRIHKSGSCSEEFMNFMDFYNWAIKVGYKPCQTILRYDSDEPYGPENCFFTDTSEKQSYLSDSGIRASIERFDATVAKIRKACGMEPLRTEKPQNKGE